MLVGDVEDAHYLHSRSRRARISEVPIHRNHHRSRHLTRGNVFWCLLELHNLVVEVITLIQIKRVRSQWTLLLIRSRIKRVLTVLGRHNSLHAKWKLLLLLMAAIAAFPDGFADFDFGFRG